jgi:N-acetylmuramic acid 6-phosphate (MurNAc-6-P) etherase
MSLSITETPNELTRDLDMASPLGIARILRQTDSQIYNGYLGFPGFQDKEFLDAIEDCIRKTNTILKSKEKKVIILAGAGTSGRLGMFVARDYNPALQKAFGEKKLIQYLMAGFDQALIAAQEGSEDDAVQAVEDLKAVIGDAKQVAYIGVTCGMSAPYVAGQLDYLLNQFESKKLKGYAGLMGFNLLDRARNVPIENWNKTFKQVSDRTAKSPFGIILNPIAGPEPVTGSTRMKSGTSTKLILDMIFNHCITLPADIPAAIKSFLKDFETTRTAVYEQEEAIAELITKGGETLSAKGHIYYLAKAPYGILSLVDASECPPTFGADFEDVRGFLEGGWKALQGKGEDLSYISPVHRIGIEEFMAAKLPKLTANDLIIVIGDGTAEKLLEQKVTQGMAAFKGEWNWKKILQAAKKKKASTALIAIQPKAPAKKAGKITGIDYIVSPAIPLPLHFKEVGVKLVLNAITTGAHIMAGKVYQNRMVDLKISNNKLYFRTIKIIMDIMKVDEVTARDAVLKSIYATDKLTPKILNTPISAHINTATEKTKVVPRALLLATGKLNYAQADEAIKKEPIVRHIVQKWAL